MDIQNFLPINRSVKWNCIRFDFDGEHPQLVLDWLEARGIELHEIPLPKIGFIVGTTETGPIALGFLRRSEGHLGILEWFITNPSIESALRNDALDLLIVRLISSAKRRKLYKIMGHVQDENALMRAKRHGFSEVSQNIVALSVS